MKILLTNDDGIDAPGLKALYDAFIKSGNEVCITAPLTNRSGASCSVSMGRALRLEKRDWNAFALDGSPVDCVISALKGGYIPFHPDVVFSGINSDGNIGTDILYSGTCGAARQACLYGIPGIALSAEKMQGSDGYIFKPLADFAAKNIEKLIGLCGNLRNKEEGGGYAFFVNVNAPSAESYKGVRFADVSRRDYHDSVEVSVSPDGSFLSRCIGEGKIETFGGVSSDYALVKDGYVSVSVLCTDAAVDKSYKDGWF
ncbi:MAG: 5'/3'-nucleotidase SurE [Treponema sp.]|nr:5'/3'-nucleotidase SurE [Treponema sp.]MBQ5384767.1 5'/3'-nucleotidase SurE [Treponema sp.]